jgi:hypothetical protein
MPFRRPWSASSERTDHVQGSDDFRPRRVSFTRPIWAPEGRREMQLGPTVGAPGQGSRKRMSGYNVNSTHAFAPEDNGD